MVLIFHNINVKNHVFNANLDNVRNAKMDIKIQMENALKLLMMD